MIRHIRLLVLLTATVHFGSGLLGAADPAGSASPESSVKTELELLRAQIALQQQQIEELKRAITDQQQQINKVAGLATPAEVPLPQLAGLRPLDLRLTSGLTNGLPSSLGTKSIGLVPAWAIPSPPQLQATAAAADVPAGMPALAAAAILPRSPVPHSQEQEHAEVRQPKKWYEKYSIRGYVQLRHNRLLQTNDDLVCQQCDGATAINNNFTLRRARMVLSGEISDQISLYFQPDFAVTNTNLHFAQVRDLYADIALDKKKEFRFRVGQSKLPYGFENMQSSQNRLALDRNDAMNSAFANERDLGVTFYWAPAHIRARFNELTTSGLKGSGDYGVVGVGMANGQILNMAEQNNDLHYVAHVTYPFKLRNGQFIEAGIQAYTGKYTVASRSTGTQGLPGFRYDDRRAAATIVIYPQPLGLQAEYNFGTGPEYNAARRFIEQKGLEGGYAQLMYMRRWGRQIMTPFYRFTNYGGGKKFEIDARHYVVRDHEVGVEYQPNPYLEFVLQYGRGFRIFEDAARPNWQQSGHQLRLQLQFNY